jgi:hypothetical protein
MYWPADAAVGRFAVDDTSVGLFHRHQRAWQKTEV